MRARKLRAVSEQIRMATRSPMVQPRVLPGLLLVAVGILFTLHNFSVVDARRLWRFWPLLLIAFGLSSVLDADKRKRGLGVALMAAGAILQLNYLGWLDLRFRDLRRFWPLIPIVVGVLQLIGKHRSRSLTGSLLLIGLGIYFQLSTLGLIRFDLWKLWPIVLIIVGIEMVRRAVAGRSWGH
jgi:hypothetical protein